MVVGGDHRRRCHPHHVAAVGGLRHAASDNMTDLFAPRGRWGRESSIMDRLDIGDCWIWTGGLKPNGYGEIRVNGKLTYPHRVVWEALVGPIEDGLEIDHLCRVPTCCNPDHLEPVTHKENVRRGLWVHSNRRRKGTHCQYGHRFTTGIGGRNVCNPCRNARRRQRRKEVR